MTPRAPLPRPVFTREERALIDVERAALKAAFAEAGLKERRDGFPFRQYRLRSIRELVRDAPREAWIRNGEHAGLLLAFARTRDDPRLYVRIPYAALLGGLAASGLLDAARLPPDVGEALSETLQRADEFAQFGRERIKAAHAAVATA